MNMHHPHQKNRDRNRDKWQPVFSEVFDPKWIKEGADPKMIVYCDKLGKFLKDSGISSSQLRNIYGEINRIKLKGLQNEKSAFWLLKPKIAYGAARIDNKNQKEAFKVFFEKALQKALDAVEIENAKTFDNFQKFFEAVIAYHKYHGGKN